MRKPLALITLCLLFVSLTACIQAPVPVADAQAAYCDDLTAYQAAVQAVKDLPAEATVDDFEAAMKTVDDTYSELENSAWELADAQTEALQAQQDELRDAADSITDETTLAEARTIISTSVDSYKSTFDEVIGVSCTAS